MKNDRMKTAYSNREGRYPLYVASPTSPPLKVEKAQSGKIEIEVVVVDFGKPAEVTAQYADRPVPQSWFHARNCGRPGKARSTRPWRMTETGLCTYCPGWAMTSARATYVIWCSMADRADRADAPAKLTFQVRGVRAEGRRFFFNDKPLGTVAADTPVKTVCEFPHFRRPPGQGQPGNGSAGGPFSLAAVKLE